jgi:hypothetical protein
MNVHFDPRVFVGPRFITCPNAMRRRVRRADDRLGLPRRCRECWFTERYDLPEIQKTVIYFDQMAISEMMKALNPVSPAYERVDSFWREAFEKLDVLNHHRDRRLGSTWVLWTGSELSRRPCDGRRKSRRRSGQPARRSDPELGAAPRCSPIATAAARQRRSRLWATSSGA